MADASTKPFPGRQFGLVGAGGHALEVTEYCGRPVSFYAVDDDSFVKGLHCVSISSPDPYALDAEVVLAVGAPGGKLALWKKWPGRNFCVVVADSAVTALSAKLSPGTVVAPLAAIMAQVTLGDHVLVNTGSIVSHQSAIGAFTTLSPGVLVGGRVRIGAGVFVGIGAVIRDGVEIGDGAVIGAGAVVVDNVDAGAVMVGVPAKRIRTEAQWLKTI